MSIVSFRRLGSPTIAILCFFFTAGHVAAFTKADLYAQGKAGTVLIVAVDDRNNGVSIGSGFVVNSDGLIVTNAHVLEDSTRVLVYARNQEVYENPTTVAVDADKDLAALRIPSSSVPPLKLSKDSAPDGDEVIAIGYPRLTDVLNMGFALHPTLVPGSVNGIVLGRSRTQHRSTPFVQITGLINQGSSGGPLIDLNSGDVVGMVVLQVPYLERARDRKGVGIGSVMIRSGIGYAIPTSVIRAWLIEKDIPLQPEVAVTAAPTVPQTLRPSAEGSFATGHLLYTIAQVLPKDPDLYELAIYHYETALGVRPHDPKFLRHAGIAYAALGRFDDAIMVMQEALVQEPDSALLAYELGLAQEAIGRGTEALKTWRTFLDRSMSSTDRDGLQRKMKEAVNRLQANTVTIPTPAIFTPTSARSQ